MPLIKMEKKTEQIQKDIKKAMLDADLKYEQIGNATGRAWRYRIENVDRMTVGDFRYLCERLKVSPKTIIQ